MPSKYHIHTAKMDPRFNPIGKYATIEFREDCAGSCRNCVKKQCAYNIFKDNADHWSNMQSPEFLYICKSCYRCVENCTRGIFSLAINPEYRTLGDDYWTAPVIVSTWAQAHTGAIPVSGAGYRGRFAGEGFDSIWTDMSEIVRPTRDGIHGREYISTVTELSRRPSRLKFNLDGSLVTPETPILEIPLPVTLVQPRFGVLSQNVLLAMAAAARQGGTLLFIRPESYTPAFAGYAGSLVPCLTAGSVAQYGGLVKNSRMVEVADSPGIEQAVAELRQIKPDVFIAVGLALDSSAADRAVRLAGLEVDTLHFYGSDTGWEVKTASPRHMKDMIREIHLKLVGAKARHNINLVFSGGMALAEHMAKAILCGADAISIDIPLLIALECRLCYRCKRGKACPVQLEAIELKWGTQRMVNLLGAWHNQLLEVMGACGIREARRLRGEIGRSMWFEDLERDNFGPLFGTRKVSRI
ncbi:MAG TPA: glutamate synthase-related protein [Dehalococcoidales bacterium]|nr:glutamate synthase-related protein [Dehalococcoidales bacterium]